MEDFEKFIPRKKTSSNIPAAAISKFGRISLNSQAVKTFGIEGYQYVALFYNKNKNLIGLQFFKDKGKSDQGLVKIQGKSNTGIYFSALTFLQHYGVFTKDTAETAWYSIEAHAEENADKFFVINLATKRKKRKEVN